MWVLQGNTTECRAGFSRNTTENLSFRANTDVASKLAGEKVT